MRLPRTTTLFAAVAALILLLTVLTVAPGVGVPEASSPPEYVGIIALVAIVVLTLLLLTLLLLRGMPRKRVERGGPEPLTRRTVIMHARI